MSGQLFAVGFFELGSMHLDGLIWQHVLCVVAVKRASSQALGQRFNNPFLCIDFTSFNCIVSESRQLRILFLACDVAETFLQIVDGDSDTTLGVT